MNRKRINAFILPWLIVGAVSAAVVGTAAKNVISDALVKQKVTVTHSTEDEVPELYVIPDLVSVEPNDSDEDYTDAP